MRPIPLKLRAEIAEDPFMKKCIYTYENAPVADGEEHECSGGIEWEHAIIYAGKQVNERWAIVPCCTSGNRGSALVKEYNEYWALRRAIELLPGGLDDLQKRMSKRDWYQRWRYLNSKYNEVKVTTGGVGIQSPVVA